VARYRSYGCACGGIVYNAPRNKVSYLRMQTVVVLEGELLEQIGDAVRRGVREADGFV